MELVGLLNPCVDTPAYANAAEWEVQSLYTHPAPIKPSADTGELRERVARIVDPSAFLFSRDELDAKVRHHPHDAAYAIADAILDLIQSERGSSPIGQNDQPGLAYSDQLAALGL